MKICLISFNYFCQFLGFLFQIFNFKFELVLPEIWREVKLTHRFWQIRGVIEYLQTSLALQRHVTRQTSYIMKMPLRHVEYWMPQFTRFLILILQKSKRNIVLNFIVYLTQVEALIFALRHEKHKLQMVENSFETMGYLTFFYFYYSSFNWCTLLLKQDYQDWWNN